MNEILFVPCPKCGQNIDCIDVYSKMIKGQKFFINIWKCNHCGFTETEQIESYPELNLL
jgi:hypothetical protein